MDAHTEHTSMQLLETLLEAGVVDEQDGELRLTSAFSSHFSETEASIADRPSAMLGDALADCRSPEAELLRRHEGPLAEYVALATYTDALTHDERLRALIVFDQFYREAPPASGAPEHFVPVHGDRLSFLFELFERSIAYVWLDDCPPCNQMKETFETVFDGPPTGALLLSVYGPDWARLLHEEYDIPGGPVAVFTNGGRIEARIYGTESSQALRNEIQRHLDVGTE